MAERTVSSARERHFGPTTLVLLTLPLVVLGGVIWLFLTTGGGLDLIPLPRWRH